MIYILIFTSLFADESLFKKGNEAYQNRNYQLALEYYKQIESNGLESTALYYNMGNSYYRLGEIGYSILYYEKAKKLSPLDSDIKENLKIVNRQVIDYFEEPEQIYLFQLYQSIKYMFNINTYLWTTLILFALIFGIMFVRKLVFNEKLNLISTFALYATISLFVISVFMSYVRLTDLNDDHGVLLIETAEVYTGPDTNSQAFILHEGVKFQINRELNDRYELTLIDGKTGWIDKDLVGTI